MSSPTPFMKNSFPWGRGCDFNPCKRSVDLREGNIGGG
jgi:hypothetical protein